MWGWKVSKNYALSGQASRETDGYGIDLKWHGTKSNWRQFAGLAGIRRQRRERADAKLRRVAYGDDADAQMDADLLDQVGCDCFDCWALRTTMAWFLEDEDDDGLPYGADAVTFDDDGAHVDGCDLPRCPECAETIGLDPWWVEQRRADDAAVWR